jgi:hypothetical protein
MKIVKNKMLVKFGGITVYNCKANNEDEVELETVSSFQDSTFSMLIVSNLHFVVSDKSSRSGSENF